MVCCRVLLALLALSLATAQTTFPASHVSATHKFAAHRLAQFDHDGKPFGSRRSSLNLRAAAPAATSKPSMSGRVAVLTVGEAAAEGGVALETLLTERSPGGVLLLLPADDADIAALPDDAIAAVERALLARGEPLDIPVYFAKSDARLAALTGAGGAGAAGAALTHLTALAFEGHPSPKGTTSRLPEAVPSLSMQNFQGWLTGAKPPKGGAKAKAAAKAKAEAAAVAEAAKEKAEAAKAKAAAAKNMKPADEATLAPLRERAAATAKKAAALAAAAAAATAKADAAADDFDEFDEASGVSTVNGGAEAEAAAAAAAKEAKEAAAALKAAEAGETAEEIATAQAAAAAANAAVAAAMQAAAAKTTSGGGGGGLSLPTVAVVAHWDSFGAAPDSAAMGGAGSGSGAVAVLELARLFARLYGKTGGAAGGTDKAALGGAGSLAPPVNLLFLLTAGGTLNYAGAREWLGAADERILDSLEFVLCLDDALGGGGDGGKLYLHVSKPKEKDAMTRRVYGAFEATAAALGMGDRFELVHKKIDVSKEELAWEHEQFALKRLLSATLSHRRAPTHALRASGGGSAAKLGGAADAAALARTVKFVAEALARHVYGLDDGAAGPALQVATAGDVSGVNTHFVRAWSTLMSATARPSSMGALAAPLAGAVEDHLRQHTHASQTQRFSLVEPYTFYTHSSATLGLFTVQPLAFDAQLFVGVLAYLLALHAYMVGPANVSAKSVHKLFSKA